MMAERHAADSRPPQAAPIVNYLSESAFGFQGNGVHTAFLNTLSMMRATGAFRVKANSFGPYAILHAHTFGPLYWLMKWLHRGKRVIHAHAIPDTLVGQVMGTGVWLPIFTSYLVMYFNSADAVICMTEQLRTYLAKMGVRRPMTVVSLPMDLSRFSRSAELRASGRRKLGFTDADHVVLCVGQIIPRKGFFDFIEVARQNPEQRFVWVGEIPFSVASESYFRVKHLVSHAPPNVTFPGVFELHEMPEFYNAADVFFFPSLQETFGLAIAEAAACEVPLVLRDLATYRESFGGHYLAADGVEGFTAHLRALKCSESLRQEYGARGMNAVRRYDTTSVADDLTRLYRQVLGER